MSKISEIVNDQHYVKTQITENSFLKTPIAENAFLLSDGTSKDTRTLKEIQEEHYKTLDYNKPSYKYKKPEIISCSHKKEEEEMVNHPKHYSVDDDTYEPYKVISAWDCNFNIGSAIKYLARFKKKWNPIEDLQKAKQYIDFEIEKLNNEKKHED